jgi:mannose-6-phosphate isomerase
MKEAQQLFYLEGVPQYYAWGGQSLIPALVPSARSGDKPVAEYWLGAHQMAPSLVINDKKSPLDQLVASDADKILGKPVAQRFGRLPYLLKLLDVKDMLSIQVHPSKKEAEQEFARENADGIPLNAPNRNYKDDNHKPELMVALSDFWLLHGFKPREKLIRTLQKVPELNSLLQTFEGSGYEGLYKSVMEMPQQEVNKILKPLIDHITPLYNAGKLDKSQEDFWAARAALTFSREQAAIDRGIFSIYFFNLLHLKKGEAIFQDAGVPHAYLEGQNVEIMANSDNVLRGGLTNKHIDVKELLKHVKFEPAEIKIQTGKKVNDKELVFQTPAPDFQLSVFHLNKNDRVSFTASTAEIVLLTEGSVALNDGAKEISLEKGHPSAIIFSEAKIQCTALQNAVLYKASVPVHISE